MITEKKLIFEKKSTSFMMDEFSLAIFFFEILNMYYFICFMFYSNIKNMIQVIVKDITITCK